MELISIIVPVYNVEQYLPACLDSIVNQTYRNIEIILVDDGSTDNSGRICDEYAAKDSRIVVIHQKNAGVSSARNLGIENSNGKGVLFIDSDDTVDLQYVDVISRDWNPEKDDLIICNIRDIYIDRISNKRPISGILKGNFFYDYYLLIDLLRVPVIKLYRKSIIDKYNIRFPANIKTAEDQIWNFKYYKYVKTYRYIDKGIYNYYHRENQSLSSLKDRRSFLDNIAKLYCEKEFLYSCLVYNSNYILTNHALSCLKQFSILEGESNSYNSFKKRLTI